MTNFTSIPDQLDLFEFFESDPIISRPSDGFWLYQFKDSTGISVLFSFHIFERSVQTIVCQGNRKLITVCHEGAESLKIEGKDTEASLIGNFTTGNGETTLELRLKPLISVQWGTLDFRN